MSYRFDSKYPDISFLREKAKRQIPKFAFEYLDGGCNSEVNLKKNTDDIRDVQLSPYYLRDFKNASLRTNLFGKEYDAPFGIAPIGLQGLMWPKASEILAQAAFANNLPFILSTVATASIETIAEITEGNAWFQLYHPKHPQLRDQIIDRLSQAHYPVLVILADTPTFGYRPKEMVNGLSIPPKITVKNIVQILTRPSWAWHTALMGIPEFQTLKPYIPPGSNLKHLGEFMNKTFDGRLNIERIKPIRDQWKGKLVIKGLTTEEDVKKAVELGLDGVVISNHGGRQIDRGESTIQSLQNLGRKFKDQITIMMDSGIRTGPDIATSLASGAQFTFLGRSFMYGVAALGKNGGYQVIDILKRQLIQVMEQIGCEDIKSLSNHLIHKK